MVAQRATWETKQDGHICFCHTDWGGCGHAVDRCVEDTQGRFWAENDEYATQVLFCPFCGTKAPTQPGR